MTHWKENSNLIYMMILRRDINMSKPIENLRCAKSAQKKIFFKQAIIF